jgi:hypothetical protein
VGRAGATLGDHREERDRDGFVVYLRPAAFRCEQPEAARESRQRFAEWVALEHLEPEPDMFGMGKFGRIECSGFQREQFLIYSRFPVDDGGGLRGSINRRHSLSSTS